MSRKVPKNTQSARDRAGIYPPSIQFFETHVLNHRINRTSPFSFLCCMFHIDKNSVAGRASSSQCLNVRTGLRCKGFIEPLGVPLGNNFQCPLTWGWGVNASICGASRMACIYFLLCHSQIFVLLISLITNNIGVVKRLPFLTL